MIVQRYADFRGIFAEAGALIGLDGFEVWSTAKLRAAGFSTLTTPTITSYPLTLTCNAGAADASPGVHEYDWYLSQRCDPPSLQYFTLTHSDTTKSGTVLLSLNIDQVARLLPGLSGPDLLTPASLEALFKNVGLYVSRRADKAYQWCRLVAGV